MENLKKLNRVINKLMEKESLRESAEKIGVSYGWLRNLKKGYDHRPPHNPIKPRPQILEKIAEAYNYPLQELLELAGYMESKNETIETRYKIFEQRVNDLLEKNNMTLEQLASKSEIPSDIYLQVFEGTHEFEYRILYSAAHAFDVTPDYLAGYTDDPKEITKEMPKPVQFKEFLERNEIMFNDILLSQEDKERIERILTEVFYDAHRRRNNR
ncbi:helix-turn-helix transcriptional regulator [Aneurinibacillus thermoaerophilus]|jgi:transcriptional regulator with XRE-family HTH domain|uniref:helix-turn-helix transcriptional regulator n=1 Tax=Aneurinibacillus thermoaerophilus TaxID=143495 RepID=UPI002E228738|nr:helix-turn-helix transcriptional regulator [Aneurinibacillus thermoaerophilus]MED0738859.1 helix-turn-helix transcriptional regulator [Aneurinibacillus thermoaerophilus]